MSPRLPDHLSILDRSAFCLAFREEMERAGQREAEVDLIEWAWCWCAPSSRRATLHADPTFGPRLDRAADGRNLDP